MFPNTCFAYPIIRMLVSNTETTMSLSKLTLSMTNFTARSNSFLSPIIANVSNVSINVIEKLKNKNQKEYIERIFLLLVLKWKWPSTPPYT